MKGLSVKWQKLIVWLTGYVNIIAFVIAGGYLFKNTGHEEVRRSAKTAFAVTAVFTAVDALRALIQYCYNLASPTSSDWLNKASWVILIIRTVVFAVLLIVDMTVGFGSAKKAENADGKVENTDAADNKEDSENNAD